MTTANIYRRPWLDQVFEQRNKKYGAYELRMHADDYTLKGLLMAILIFSSFFIVPIMVTALFGEGTVPPSIIRGEYKITSLDVPVIPPAAVDPVPPSASIPKLTHDIINPLVVTNDAHIPDEDDHSELKNNENENNTSLNGTAMTNDSGTFKGFTESPLPVNDTVYPMGAIELMPKFPGGEDAMMEYLAGNLKYPKYWIEDGISGTVYLSFIVNKNGEVTDVRVLHGLKESRDFENEAIRVVTAMPNWKPGRQNGQNVSVSFTLPVRFLLK